MYFNKPTSLVPQGQDGDKDGDKDRDKDGDGDRDSMLSAA